MTPTRPGCAYRAIAGVVTRRGQPMTDAAARSLLGFLARAALERRRRGDRAGARYCASTALDLAAALVAADDWRRAAAGLGRSGSEFAPLRSLIRELSGRPDG